MAIDLSKLLAISRGEYASDDKENRRNHRNHVTSGGCDVTSSVTGTAIRNAIAVLHVTGTPPVTSEAAAVTLVTPVTPQNDDERKSSIDHGSMQPSQNNTMSRGQELPCEKWWDAPVQGWAGGRLLMHNIVRDETVLIDLRL